MTYMYHKLFCILDSIRIFFMIQNRWSKIFYLENRNKDYQDLVIRTWFGVAINAIDTKQFYVFWLDFFLACIFFRWWLLSIIFCTFCNGIKTRLHWYTPPNLSWNCNHKLIMLLWSMHYGDLNWQFVYAYKCGLLMKTRLL